MHFLQISFCNVICLQVKEKEVMPPEPNDGIATSNDVSFRQLPDAPSHKDIAVVLSCLPLSLDF